MTRRASPEAIAVRLAERMQAAGRKVARVIVEGERVEVVLDTGETQAADPYEEWKRARATTRHS